VNRSEHLRRLGEVANILLDAGLIVVATARELSQEDMDVIRTAAGADRVISVWLGDRTTTDLRHDLLLPLHDAETEGVARLKGLLLESGAIFRAW
jgi:bifunctional enzyme CysN/CysC